MFSDVYVRIQIQNMTIYHLGNKVEYYLISTLYPDAKIIPSKPIQETAERILALLAGDNEMFIVIDLTQPSNIPFGRQSILMELERNGVRLYNTADTDHSKRRLQQLAQEQGLNSLTANREGDANELLIVKSNYNFGGKRDREFSLKYPELQIPTPKRFLASNYDVMTRDQIDQGTWLDDEVQIERFVHNKGELYFRVFYHLGVSVVSKIRNPNRIKKGGVHTDRWNYEINDHYESDVKMCFNVTLAYALHTKLDHFSADIVMDDDGKLYLVDLNPTPSWLPPGDKRLENRTPGFYYGDIPDRLKRWNLYGRPNQLT
jgi:hypothetical protein